MKSLEDYLLVHPKHTLIFDFDRTLVALDLPWEIFRMGIRASLNPFDRNLVNLYSKGQIMEMINAFVKQYKEPARKAVIEYSTYFETHYIRQAVPNTFLINFIKQNKQLYHFALWSSNTAPTITKWLTHYHLSNHFHSIVSRDTVKHVKPDPEGFYEIYRISKSKEDYLMIGDSQRDEEAAKAAGIDFFKIEMKTPFDTRFP